MRPSGEVAFRAVSSRPPFGDARFRRVRSRRRPVLRPWRRATLSRPSAPGCPRLETQLLLENFKNHHYVLRPICVFSLLYLENANSLASSDVPFLPPVRWRHFETVPASSSGRRRVFPARQMSPSLCFSAAVPSPPEILALASPAVFSVERRVARSRCAKTALEPAVACASKNVPFSVFSRFSVCD